MVWSNTSHLTSDNIQTTLPELRVEYRIKFKIQFPNKPQGWQPIFSFDEEFQLWVYHWKGKSMIGFGLPGMFYKRNDGKTCPIPLRITSESLCMKAANHLRLTWGESFDNPVGDNQPGCFFANDGRSKVFFNRNLKAYGLVATYAEICTGWYIQEFNITTTQWHTFELVQKKVKDGYLMESFLDGKYTKGRTRLDVERRINIPFTSSFTEHKIADAYIKELYVYNKY